MIDGVLYRLIMAVDRMQWGAEEWQYADLHMPDDPSPYENDAGLPCVMLMYDDNCNTIQYYLCVFSIDERLMRVAQ